MLSIENQVRPVLVGFMDQPRQVETTHAIAGGVAGVGTSHSWRAVLWAWGKRIVDAWILGFPGAALVEAASYLCIHLLLEPLVRGRRGHSSIPSIRVPRTTWCFDSGIALARATAQIMRRPLNVPLSRMRRDPDQRCDLAPAEPPQFGQFGQQGNTELRSHAGHCGQQLGLGPGERCTTWRSCCST
jgi:hypothetical protein